MISVLIVDDEQKARNVLRHYLETFVPSVSDIREAGSVDEALQLLQERQPHIVFLDIEMPHRNGFDLLRSTEQMSFEVIFTTAYNQYAIQAIRFSALDYLLKPVDPEELVAAVARYQEKSEESAARVDLYRNLVDNIGKKDINGFRIAVPSSEGVQFFTVADILRLEAEGSYTKIVLTNRKPFVASKTLKHFEEMLEEFNFIRTHKSHLVNHEHIKGMTPDRDFVVLADDSTVEISRRKKDEVKQLLGLK
ncbi:MAG: response regulator transcription factor [Flavobacteriales bacterium]|nr:response regulator transcription factor [Flavobacteriales bacterium]